MQSDGKGKTQGVPREHLNQSAGGGGGLSKLKAYRHYSTAFSFLQVHFNKALVFFFLRWSELLFFFMGLEAERVRC